MEDEIKKFIWSFINDEDGGNIKFTEENTQKLQKYIKQGYYFEEDSIYKNGNSYSLKDGLEAVLYLAELEFGIKFKWECVGDYTSCGYDMFCWAWACVLPNNELYFDSWMQESY